MCREGTDLRSYNYGWQNWDLNLDLFSMSAIVYTDPRQKKSHFSLFLPFFLSPSFSFSLPPSLSPVCPSVKAKKLNPSYFQRTAFAYDSSPSISFEDMQWSRCCGRPRGVLNSFEHCHNTMWSVEFSHTKSLDSWKV